jgi:hypothetical protein
LIRPHIDPNQKGCDPSAMCKYPSTVFRVRSRFQAGNPLTARPTGSISAVTPGKISEESARKHPECAAGTAHERRSKSRVAERQRENSSTSGSILTHCGHILSLKGLSDLTGAMDQSSHDIIP